MRNGSKLGLLKAALLAFAIHNPSFLAHNSAFADSFKCGVETANKVAASTAPAAKGSAIYKAVEALKEDDFDEEKDRQAALKTVRDALLDEKSRISGEDESTLRHYLFAVAAGIQPGVKGGWDDFELAPQPVEWLKFAEAEKETPAGKIKSSWKYADGKCIWRFSVPEGTKATVCVNGTCKRYAPGEYTLEIKE